MTLSVDTTNFSLSCTGDVCRGDTILFTEAVFSGSFRRPHYDGDRRIVAKVLSDSYGDKKQQHTFTLLVIASDGVDPIAPDTRIKRKGRNIYRKGTTRLRWENEADRKAALDEKHGRGSQARAERSERREDWSFNISRVLRECQPAS